MILKVIAGLALLIAAIAAWDIYRGRRSARRRFEQRDRNLAHQMEWRDREEDR